MVLSRTALRVIFSGRSESAHEVRARWGAPPRRRAAALADGYEGAPVGPRVRVTLPKLGVLDD